jgi:hypothetical protein
MIFFICPWYFEIFSASVHPVESGKVSKDILVINRPSTREGGSMLYDDHFTSNSPITLSYLGVPKE